MSYISGYDQPIVQQVEPENTWLDYLIKSNPHGVMRVLSVNGYVGYLAPQDKAELSDATYEFVQKKGDYAIIELLKSHPLYDVIIGISKEEKQIPITFKNATGEQSSVMTTINTINYVKLLETALIVIGAFYVADKLWGFLK